MSDRRSIAQDRLQGIINQGRAKAAAVINKVMTEVPDDRIVRAKAMEFKPTDTGVQIIMPKTEPRTLHRNAQYQVAEKAGIPVKFLDELSTHGDWGRSLLAHNLNTLFAHQDSNTRYLVRSVKSEARGFLTDKYRRMDSRPIVEAFASSLQQVGALPYDGFALDTRIAISAILPELYEPIPGEIIAFGGTLQNSDFGNGALAFNLNVLRLICINGAIGFDMLRKVHLGRRLADDVVFSEETYELDTRTMISAIRDTVKNGMGKKLIEGYVDQVRAANDDKITASDAAVTLKKFLSKGQIQKVLEAYNGADIEMLPAGNTTWRLSNAISWVAGQTDDQEEKLDLQKVAGALLPAAA